jgi:hypothetical protein
MVVIKRMDAVNPMVVEETVATVRFIFQRWMINPARKRESETSSNSGSDATINGMPHLSEAWIR